MSLLSTIQQSSGALQTAQIGLQVVGNNIANTNTPGYIRQQLQQSAAVASRLGNLILGQGVRATGIVQVVDQALAERMFDARTALSGSESLEKAYNQLEELTTDLDNTGLGHQLSLFNNSLHELSTQPGDTALRDFVILQGDTLANSINRAHADALERQQIWNDDLAGIANQVNRLIERIARLNLDIATIEGGGLIHSDAAGLRDQRLLDLEELASFVDINVQEQESGSVAVFVGGDYLVSNGNYREVYAAYSSARGGSELRIIETDSPLQATSGALAATMAARDTVFGDYVNEIDQIATTLIRAVNEVHSQGQGRTGLQELTSSVAANAGVPLEAAGLAWTPRNGTFDLSVVDVGGEVISNHRISVRMLGQVGDSTINSIVADIDAIDGLTARMTSDGRIEIASDSPTAAFTFGEDTSGFLAAAGINGFFVGDGAVTIKVNQALKENSDLLSISRGGIGADTEALTGIIDLVDQPLESLGGRSVRGTYEETIAGLGQKVSLQKSGTEGLRYFYATLQSQHLAVTGVNIDEESIKMIGYQRAFQASSRVIATAAEMLELLVSL